MPETTSSETGSVAPSARTGGAEAAGADAMNRLIRQRSGRPAPGETETSAPETVAARMRTRAQEIDAQLGEGKYPEANERAFWRGYAQAMDDWAEAAETGASPSGTAGR